MQKRYSQALLRRKNLRYVRLQHSPNKSAKKSFQKLETAKIDKYKKKFGKYLQEIAADIKDIIMNKISLQNDTPGYLKIWEIEEELLDFEKILEEKYISINFEFAFCFRVLYSTDGIKSKTRFYKEENWLGLDLIMPEAEFTPHKKDINMQRKIMGNYFFPFFTETIKKYSKKLASLKPVAEDLIKDMELFLLEKRWL